MQVLNVGDGACTIARSDRDGKITIIDCGSTTPAISGNPAAAVQSSLGLALSNLDTLVVTHFDADHWHGFRDLAPFYKEAIRNSTKPVKAPRLIYAGMPRHTHGLAHVIHALQALASDTGVRPLDLRESWKSIGVPLQAEMLFRGDKFQASGHEWDVLWPPRNLPGSVSSWIQAAINSVQQLAGDMADKGENALKENLQEAYELWSDTETNREGKRSSEGEEDTFSEEVWDRPESELREFDLRAKTPGRTLDGPYGKLPKRYARSFRARFAEVSKKLATANNFLSLVVAQDRKFISFGDIKLNALTAMLRMEAANNDSRSNHYCISLAPHHGSHHIPARALQDYPSSCLCVSQSGPRLYRYAKNHFYRSKPRPRHEALEHLYTHKSGILTARPHPHGSDCHFAAFLAARGQPSGTTA